MLVVHQKRALRRDVRRVVAQMSQRNRLIEGIVGKKLSVELWNIVCAPDMLTCVTGDNLDHRPEQRVEELAVSVLML